jgi:gamma-glutamyltranspeptidase/glutathione hydrolase
MLETFDVPAHGAEWASLIGQAMQVALADRGRSLGDDERASARIFTSRAHAVARAREIAIDGPAARAPARDTVPGPAAPAGDNTTHLSTADAAGWFVALTQSLGPSLGTRAAASGTGVVYATRLGSVPGSRPASTVAPTFVLRDGRVRYVLGGAGDSRIITAVIQTLSRAIDHGMTLDLAVAAPRLHPVSAAELRLEEGRWDDATQERLRALGFQLSTGPATYYGRVHAIAIDPATGRFTGVAEPRGSGGAAAPLR